MTGLEMLWKVMRPRKKTAPPPALTWILGNLLIIGGIYTVLYIGGVYATAEYQRLAARGDTPLAAPETLGSDSLLFHHTPSETSSASTSTDSHETEKTPAAPINRIVIPSIDLDAKVAEIGKKEKQLRDGPIQVWDVPNFVAGHHSDSAKPGEGDNIVLSGHVGGYSGIFEHLFYVQPGDPIILYSNHQQYRYIVRDRLILEEENASQEQRDANARYIQPVGEEVVTLVTCWPPKGKHRYEQRIILRAFPYQNTAMPDSRHRQAPWSIR
jgi:LPXTG-site transpeptidase (sortase) family protein